MVIKIHIYLFLVLAYMYSIQNLEIFVLAYVFILLHEIAHILVATLMKIKVYEVELLPIGVNAKYCGKISANKEFIISIAGPITSFLFYKFLQINILKQINLFIAITNLIPLKPYDGGRIIYSLFTILMGNKYVSQIYIILQKVCLNLLAILAIISFVKFKNYYLVIACIYIICIAKEELKNEKFNALIRYLQIE